MIRGWNRSFITPGIYAQNLFDPQSLNLYAQNVFN